MNRKKLPVRILIHFKNYEIINLQGKNVIVISKIDVINIIQVIKNVVYTSDIQK